MFDCEEETYPYIWDLIEWQKGCKLPDILYWPRFFIGLPILIIELLNNFEYIFSWIDLASHICVVNHLKLSRQKWFIDCCCCSFLLSQLFINKHISLYRLYGDSKFLPQFCSLLRFTKYPVKALLVKAVTGCQPPTRTRLWWHKLIDLGDISWLVLIFLVSRKLKKLYIFDVTTNSLVLKVQKVAANYSGQNLSQVASTLCVIQLNRAQYSQIWCTFARAARFFNWVNVVSIESMFIFKLYRKLCIIIRKVFKRTFQKTPWKQTILKGFYLFWIIFDFGKAPHMHTQRRCQGQIQSHCSIFCERGSEKFWTRLNVIGRDFSCFRTCKFIIFEPHRGNAPSSARQLRQTSFLQNITV